MPLKHQRAFRVRNYECDAHGTIFPATLLRYMQEAAMDASTAAGYSVAWYHEHAHMWLIRETDLAVYRWLGLDDDVTITTWVADFRRVRSRRAYELHSGGELVARAFTDWVYLDTEAQRPVTVPDSMVAAFWPDGAPTDTPPRETFPTAETIPDDRFQVTRHVTWSDLDQAEHVNNAMYLTYMADCGAQAPDHDSLVPEPETHASPAPCRYRIQYREPALYGDALTVSTWAESNGSAPARWYTVHRAADDTLLTQAQLVTLDAD